MMSKEREFIRLWYENIELWKVHAEELLAQPEKKIIDLNMVDNHLDICNLSEDYKDGYVDGIVYAEREHGIRGQHE